LTRRVIGRNESNNTAISIVRGEKLGRRVVGRERRPRRVKRAGGPRERKQFPVASRTDGRTWLGKKSVVLNPLI